MNAAVLTLACLASLLAGIALGVMFTRGLGATLNDLWHLYVADGRGRHHTIARQVIQATLEAVPDFTAETPVCAYCDSTEHASQEHYLARIPLPGLEWCDRNWHTGACCEASAMQMAGTGPASDAFGQPAIPTPPPPPPGPRPYYIVPDSDDPA